MSSLVFINRQNLLSNLQVIAQLCPGCILAPCLKSNAYGHGLAQIATILEEIKINNHPIWVTLADFGEAKVLRSSGIKTPILLVNSLKETEIEEILNMENIRVSLYSWQILRLAAQISNQYQKKLTIHLQIDTGMNWLGFEPCDILEIIRFIKEQEFLELEGIWTHFASSEDLENGYFDQQLKDFLRLKKLVIKTFGNLVKLWHCANSGAILRDFAAKNEFNLVQPGKILYGSFVTGIMRQICAQKQIILKSVLTWKTEISQIKKLQKGDSIGYNQTFICREIMEIAILPVGYFDGIPRNINEGFVLIDGQKCPFVGRICMNLSIVSLPENHNFEVGKSVVLIGRSEKKNSQKEEIQKNSQPKIINNTNKITNLTQDGLTDDLEISLESSLEKGRESRTYEEITLGLFASLCNTIGREISVGIHSQIERKII